MRAEAEAVVRCGVPAGPLAETRTAFMRYRGQGHEIAVPLTAARLDPQALRAAFDATYTALFGRTIPGLEIEALTWTLALAQPQDLPPREPPPARAAAPPPIGQRHIIDTATGETVRSAIYRRDALPPGARLPGPAAILEDGTTTIVPAGYTARVAAAGDLVLEGAAP
jgi:N-methylhydantoinase A